MIHLVIPAAGGGQRFTEAGHLVPKPLVDVLGRPMLARVIDNLRPSAPHRVTVVSQVPLPGIDADVVLTGPTGGAVETILRADMGDGPLLIANCDQLVDLDVDAFLDAPGDGALVTFRSAKPHHSYVRLDAGGFVTDIAEKRVISNHAVAGVYFFRSGADFVDAARTVIASDAKVLGEFYTSTVLAEMVRDSAKLSTVDAPSAMLGTPEELDLFLVAAHVARSL